MFQPDILIDFTLNSLPRRIYFVHRILPIDARAVKTEFYARA